MESSRVFPTHLLPETNLVLLLPGFFFFFSSWTLFGSSWGHIRREPPGNRLVDRNFSKARRAPPISSSVTHGSVCLEVEGAAGGGGQPASVVCPRCWGAHCSSLLV